MNHMGHAIKFVKIYKSTIGILIEKYLIKEKIINRYITFNHDPIKIILNQILVYESQKMICLFRCLHKKCNHDQNGGLVQSLRANIVKANI